MEISIAFRLGKWLVDDTTLVNDKGDMVNLSCLSAWEVVGSRQKEMGEDIKSLQISIAFRLGKWLVVLHDMLSWCMPWSR